MKNQNAITSTTQDFLDIHDITNDLVILKSGAVSLVITVTAMNFGLLAEEEQDAIIYGYAGLLNSLNYPIQIVIRSQTKDVTSYLNLLKQKEDETINRNRKDQIRKYREFVADLVQERNVLDKKFYVVIPASALELGLVTSQSVIPGVKSPDISTFDKSVILQRSKDLLEPKRDHLISQFSRIGLASRQLKTQELIQLFYSIYNAEASEGQRVTDTKNYTSTLVEGNIDEKAYTIDRAQAPTNLQEHTLPPEDMNSAPQQPAPQEIVQTQPAPAVIPVSQPSPVPAPVAPSLQPPLPQPAQFSQTLQQPVSQPSALSTQPVSPINSPTPPAPVEL
jgi:vacuolar-type H+-ATPase subunit D/Vma8